MMFILIILIVRIVSVNIYLHFIFVLRVIKCVITAYVEGIKIDLRDRKIVGRRIFVHDWPEAKV